jgi:hypothetical protein
MAMSNQTIFYTQIGSIVAFISSLFVLYRLLVQQKDATIEVLKEKNTWLQDRLETAKLNSPDVLADRLSKRISILSEELKQLSEDHDANQSVIQKKEAEFAATNTEVADLKAQIERAQEVLAEAEYFREQFGCPHCGAEVTFLGGEDVEMRIFGCGYINGEYSHPCPFDPNFPQLEDYELETKYDDKRGVWFCSPKPKTDMANELPLANHWAKTEEEARQKVIARYNYEARNVPKR